MGRRCGMALVVAWLPAACLSLDGLSAPGPADAGDAAPADAPTAAEGGLLPDALPTSDGQTPVADVSVDASDPSFFFDDFNRADGGLGRSWMQKRAGVFFIAQGAVRKLDTNEAGTTYQDNMAYRPPVESILDVEVSIEFRFLGAIDGCPQIFARAQGNTIATPGAYDGYLLYAACGTLGGEIARQHGGSRTVLAQLKAPFDVSSTYRLRLRTKGASPVSIDGLIERNDGAGVWTVVATGHADDADPTSVTTAGTAGFGGDESSLFEYDNFQRSASN